MRTRALFAGALALAGLVFTLECWADPASPPVIVRQPQSWTVEPGFDPRWWPAAFSVVASGAPPLAYQWQFNGEDIPGATNSGMWFDNSSTNSSGNYQVVVANSAGRATSQVAVLVVLVSPPRIFTSMGSRTVDAGSRVVFDASVSGTRGLVGWWQRNGENVPGASVFQPLTSSYFLASPPAYESRMPAPLALSSATSNEAGIYQFAASNAFGVVTSAPVVLTVVYRPPVIVASPMDQSVHAGGSAAFHASAAGGPLPALQWLRNGQPVAGATGVDYSFTALLANQGDEYTLAASNALGSATSAVARLTVIPAKPVFSAPPASRDVVAGQGIRLEAVAGADPGAAFQWQFNGTDIPGATNAVYQTSADGIVFNRTWLALAHPSAGDSGDYTAVAWNDQGSVTSAVARVRVLAPGALDRWQWRHPLPQGNDLACAVYGNGVMVALGKEGARVVSSDGGQTWAARNGGALEARGVAFGNGLFVAAGVEFDEAVDDWVARVETSPDGVVWTPQSLPVVPEEYLEDVAFGNGRFVAVLENGNALVSANGADWERVEAAASNQLDRITFGNGVFVAMGTGHGTGLHLAAVSADGRVWTCQTTECNVEPGALVFGNGVFVATGGNSEGKQVGISSNGLAWESVGVFSWKGPQAIAFGGGQFAAVTLNFAESAVSPDGRYWTSGAYNPESFEPRAMAYGGGSFVAVGDKGGIATYTNGLHWTVRSPGSPANLRSIAQGNGVIVAVGEAGLVLTSGDGAAWMRQPAPTAATLRGVAFGSGVFVAVTADGQALVSTNGAVWTASLATDASDLYSVTWGRGQFVAVGEAGQITTSADGRVWAGASSGTALRLNAVAWNGELFVAVGKGGCVVTSADGLQWSPRTAPTSEYLQGIACGNGLFVAAGHDGVLLVSSNASDWVEAPGRRPNIEDVQFANGMFVAVGAGGFAATSADGKIWARRVTSCQNDLRCSVYAAGRLIVAGNNETILQSEFFGAPILHARPARPGEAFGLTISREAGRPWMLQVSEDLVTWENVPAALSLAPDELYQESAPGLSPPRFYRVVSP